MQRSLRQRIEHRLVRVKTRFQRALARTAGTNTLHPLPPAVLRAQIAYNRLGAYCVPESSRQRPAAQAVLRGDVYEAQTIELLRQQCGRGDVVHAGTYFGDFLPGVASALKPGAKLWAFEPNAENYRCARLTVELNDLQNVVLTHAALGEAAGTSFLLTSDREAQSLGGASHLLASDAPSDSSRGHLVQVVCIDDAVPIERHVSVLQLDVEGHEQRALAGALRTLERCRPLLILEELPSSRLLASPWFRDHILALGYVRKDDVQGNAVFSCRAGA